MSETLSGAQILCRTLVEEGVQYLFGYPGGAIMPFYHALGDCPELRHILVRHEQAAAHAADGYARASGRVGVCVATSGPGATNLVTGLATAHMDSSPVLAITGQVSRPMIGRDAFQETDVIGITLPITKANWLVQDAAELADTVREAVAVALDGRPGPVLLDVPKDVQNQKAEYRPKAAARQPSPTPPAPSFADGLAAAFAPRARIVHVDRDPAEIGKNVKVTVGIAGDARDVTRRLIEAVAPRRCDAWWEEIRGYMRVRDESWRDGLSPEAICRALFAVTGERCTVVTDVGQHQMWVAKLFPYRRPNGHVTSGGLGAMGFAVPAAMGVHLARPDEPGDVLALANAERGPALVELVIEQEANVFPMIPPGGSLSEPIETAPAAAAT